MCSWLPLRGCCTAWVRSAWMLHCVGALCVGATATSLCTERLFRAQSIFPATSLCTERLFRAQSCSCSGTLCTKRAFRAQSIFPAASLCTERLFRAQNCSCSGTLCTKRAFLRRVSSWPQVCAQNSSFVRRITPDSSCACTQTVLQGTPPLKALPAPSPEQN